jgi:hypothetical protein
MGSDGFSGLDGNTHCHDSGMSNRLANIIAGLFLTFVNGFLTFIPPLVGWGRPPALPEYLFFATIETCGHVGHYLAGVDLVRG